MGILTVLLLLIDVPTSPIALGGWYAAGTLHLLLELHLLLLELLELDLILLGDGCCRGGYTRIIASRAYSLLLLLCQLVSRRALLLLPLIEIHMLRHLSSGSEPAVD